MHKFLEYAVDSGNLHISRAQEATLIFNKIWPHVNKRISVCTLLSLAVYQSFLNDKIALSLSKINSLLFFCIDPIPQNKNLIMLNETFHDIFKPRITKYKYFIEYHINFLNLPINFKNEFMKLIKNILKDRKEI